MSQLLVSNKEQLSLPYLKEGFPDMIITELPEADIVETLKFIMIEVKIGKDLHDLGRLADELTRMNSEKYAKFRKYLLCVNVAFDDYKIAVSMCMKTGVVPVFTGTLEKLVQKVKDIIAGKYESPLQLLKRPSKELTLEARVLSVIHGIADDKAHLIATLLNKGYNLKDALYMVYGTTKGNESKKISEKTFQFFFDFCQKCFGGN